MICSCRCAQWHTSMAPSVYDSLCVENCAPAAKSKWADASPSPPPSKELTGKDAGSSRDLDVMAKVGFC